MSYGHSGRGGLLGAAFRGEEVPHGTPDVVEIVERVTAGGTARRRQIGEQASGLGGELTRQSGGDLYVTGETGILRYRGETLARIRSITHRVVAIGGVEEIDVAAVRVVTLVDDLAHLAEAGRGHRAAGAAHLEELRFGELPRLGRMGDEYGLERAILAPEALYHPEEEGLRELAVAIRHAAGDIEKEEHHRMNRRLAPTGQLPVAQVLIGERLGRARS